MTAELGAQWRPIETAPKDGTPVDLWCRPYGRYADARFLKDRWRTWSLGDFDRMDYIKVDGTPTHWMPTPAGPEESE